MQHQAQETPKTVAAGSYMAIPVQGSPSPLTRSSCSNCVKAELSVSLSNMCLVVKVHYCGLSHLKVTSFESEVKGSLFQVAVSPVCVENNLGCDKLPRLGAVYFSYDLYFCPVSLAALSVKMSRVQKRLFVLPSKKARPHIVCVGVVHACTMCPSARIYFSRLKALDCLNLLSLANSTSFWHMRYALIPSTYTERSCGGVPPFSNDKTATFP